MQQLKKLPKNWQEALDPSNIEKLVKGMDAAINGTGQTMYRVEWVSLATGVTGCGKWGNDLSAVTIAINKGNAEFPGLKHTIGFKFPNDNK